MTDTKPKKQLGLKIAAVVCFCILVFAIVCLVTGMTHRVSDCEYHEPVQVSTTSTEEAAELFGDDLLLRQFAEIEGGNGTARYTLTLKDEKSTLDDRSGWRYLESFNYGDGFVCNMNIAFSGTSSYGGEFDGKTDVNGITVRYWFSPSADESGDALSAVFERGGYKYYFSYYYSDKTENYDEAWQALYTLLEN